MTENTVWSESGTRLKSALFWNTSVFFGRLVRYKEYAETYRGIGLRVFFKTNKAGKNLLHKKETARKAASTP